MNRLLVLFSLFLVLPLAAQEKSPRVVTAGGALTEIVYALGEEKCLVGADSSSVFPEAAAKLPQVGYMRMLSAEGVLSLKPTLVIGTVDAGPPPALEQIRSAGVEVLQLSNEHSPAATEERVRKVAAALKAEAKAEKLVESIRKDLKTAEEKVKASGKKPKVLFIYARGGAVVNVSGTGTAADAMIKLAGGENAVTGYEGYKPLTSEAAVAAAPDFILVTKSGLDGAGGIDKFLEQPGLALTPAGKNRRVIAMDDLLLLGFGPRLGQAVLELNGLLHPEKAVAQTGTTN